MKSKQDLAGAEGIMPVLRLFYARVREDQLIGPIFARTIEDAAWPAHLEKIEKFWTSLLFDSHQYVGRPFAPHIPLQLEQDHFVRWLQLFFFTVDEFYEGPKATEWKTRAHGIGERFWSNLQLMRGRIG